MTFTRVDAWTLDEDDPVFVAYAETVTAMLAKDDDDPTGWVYQAAIHGTSVSSPPPLANGCRHGSWYFLSWHRMYLYYFEEIVRAQVIASGGPETWALPYWNYDRDGAAALPPAFRTVGSPLHVEERNPAANAGGRLPKAITSPTFALNRPIFTGASEFGGGITSSGGQFWSETGRLEQTPHNDVHVAIGGWMGDPTTAALDPIFWLHHANIDRLWAQWQETHTDPAEPNWLDQSFDFADATGRTVSMSTSQAVKITALDYTYDSSTVQPEPAEAATGVSA